jgi:hypothetical protein
MMYPAAKQLSEAGCLKMLNQYSHRGYFLLFPVLPGKIKKSR